jgi:hypothetical protein
MFNTIGVAITAFFNMITVLCGAGEKAAGAVDHLAGWGKEAAATFEDEAKSDRALSLEEQAFKRAMRKKELEAKRIAADAEADAVIKAAKTAAKSPANAS